MLTHVRFEERDLTVQEQMLLHLWSSQSDLFALETLVMLRIVEPRGFTTAQFRALTMRELFSVVLPELSRVLGAAWADIKNQVEAMNGLDVTKPSKPS